MCDKLALKIIIYVISLLLFFHSAFIVLNYINARFSPYQNKELITQSTESPTFENRSKGNNDNQNNNLKNPQNISKKYNSFQNLQDQGITIAKESLTFINSAAGSIVWTIINLFLILGGLFYFSVSLDRPKNELQTNLSTILKLPIDLFGFFLIGCLYINTFLGIQLLHFLSQKFLIVFPDFFLLFALIFTIDFALIYAYYLLIITQFKMHSLITSSLIYLILGEIIDASEIIFDFIKKFFDRLPLIIKELSIILFFLLSEFFLIYYFILKKEYRIILFIALILLNLSIIYIYIRFSLQFKKTKKAIFNLASGKNSKTKMEEHKISNNFEEVSKAISQIDEKMNLAISEKEKSDLFKTELITNVSHDIKTPLTSIIMYIDLLRRENIDNEAAKKYLAVLVKQSDRLKNLIDDLIDASKITTNNIKVNLIPLDLNQFLAQIQAEYEDKLRSKKLKLIVTISSDTQIIVADSKYFIRVFDNLLNNIQRYALPDTRIYLDVITYDPDVINIRISNVSAEKINVSAEQLMERFVQGDSSRNHEGSGIGLAIAKSLMEAQNGSMQIKVNDDLFTVDLKIPKYLPKSIDSDELY